MTQEEQMRADLLGHVADIMRDLAKWRVERLVNTWAGQVTDQFLREVPKTEGHAIRTLADLTVYAGAASDAAINIDLVFSVDPKLLPMNKSRASG